MNSSHAHSVAPSASRSPRPSYFDKYPERKGQGPYVPKPNLTSSPKPSSSASASEQLSHSPEVLRYTNTDPQICTRKVSRLTPKEEQTSRQWHSRDRRSPSHSARTSAASTHSSQKCSAPAMPLQTSSSHTMPVQTSNLYTMPLQTNNTHTVPLSEQPQQALEEYRAKTMAAAVARHSAAPRDAKPLEGRAARQLDGNRIAEKDRHSGNKPRPLLPSASVPPVLSIDDIIRKHSPGLSPNGSVSSVARSKGSTSLQNESSYFDGSVSDSDSSSSVDSVEREVRQSLSFNSPPRATQIPSSSSDLRNDRVTQRKSSASLMKINKLYAKKSTPSLWSKAREDQFLHHERSGSTHMVRSGSLGVQSQAPQALSVTRSQSSNEVAMRWTSGSPAPPPPLSGQDDEIHVHSPKLSHVLTLSGLNYRGLKVSFADVGDANGHPVFVFLGLGAVRYLVGLYDEMASALKLRLVCIDRWGLGKTDDLPAERRGVLEWSTVVGEVAGHLGINKFSLLAHSAGAPYAMASCLTHQDRIVGPVHLLAPWVSPSIESGYKWLRYVPDGVIRTAQAAEWRMQAWRLGTNKSNPYGDSPERSSASHSDSPLDLSLSDSDAPPLSSQRIHAPLPPLPVTPQRSTDSTLSRGNQDPVPGSPSPSAVPSLCGGTTSISSASSGAGLRPSPTPSTEEGSEKDSLRLSTSTACASRSERAEGAKSSPDPSPSKMDLPTALLRASYAESQRGGANDLLVILGRSSQRPWGFVFPDIKHPVHVWHGEKDDRVNISSVLWMEREMSNCRVEIVKGAGHNLMTNVSVVVEALESIARHRGSDGHA